MPSGLRCQKCNSVLKIDKSLADLSIAQQKLLIGKIGTESKNEPELNPVDYISPDRLKLYNKVKQKAMYDSLSDESDNENESGIQSSKNEQSNHLINSTSFVLLSHDSEDEDEDKHEGGVHKYNNESRTNGKDKKKDKHVAPKSISQRIATLNNIFQILSSNQDIDHPLCLECSNLLVENFKLKFDQNQKEKENYLAFLKKLKSQENAYSIDELDDKLSGTLDEFQELKLLESEKLHELRKLESTKTDLELELNELEKEYDQLVNGELNSVLQLKNQTDLELSYKYNNLEKSKASYQNYLDHLDQLRSLNIYKEIFSITFDSQYGTINGFRIGYKVPWSENNAALGQIVLLLVFLLKRFNLKLNQYKLVPMGSQSHIVKIITNNNNNDNSTETGNTTSTSTKTILELHTSNEFSLGKLFNYNKLDISMIALLDIISQIEEKMMSVDSELVLPYSISIRKGTIGGKSIRVTSNGEWTTSCKFLLTNLNWLLLHSSVH